MLNLINAWFENDIMPDFNGSKNIIRKLLKSNTIDFDFSKTPANQQYLNYIISIEESSRDFAVADRGWWDAEIRIQLCVMMAAKTYEDFQDIVDKDVVTLAETILKYPRYDNSDISSSLSIHSVKALTFGADEIQGSLYKPYIRATLRMYKVVNESPIAQSINA